ncbi:MAG: hypothetical protein HY820_10575 [Acidobacteria bacterium]|nr:hypothetical protein [Acidobacteriota bacterium]
MQVLRSMLAVLLGFATFGISSRLFFQLTGIDLHRPANFFVMLLGVLFSAVVAFVAGYAAGWIAGQKPLIHAMSIAMLLVFGVGMSLIVGGSKWSMVSTLVVSIPMTFVGALAYSRKLASKAPPPPKPEDPFQNLDEMLKD